jgi:hypothetical protein
MPPSTEDGSDHNVDDVDDDDDDNDDGDARPDFMPDARDIMNKFPRRPDAAASTEIRAFRETFGTSLLVVNKVWSMLLEEDVLPEGGRPKYLLWALHFLRVYSLQAPGCAAVGASGGAVDPKTHRKWVWAFIDAIAELVDNVVSKITMWGPVRKRHCAKMLVVNRGEWRDDDEYGRDGGRCGQRASLSKNPRLSVYADVFFFNIRSSPPPRRRPCKRRSILKIEKLTT